jgi:hypothetical protein
MVRLGVRQVVDVGAVGLEEARHQVGEIRPAIEILAGVAIDERVNALHHDVRVEQAVTRGSALRRPA